jgi:ElaB/YqjD/DUF883 family membrane-anchored ribosome-binding protein
MNATNESMDKLVHDLRTVVRDGEELLRATADDASDKDREEREKITTAVNSARETCQKLEQRAIEAARDAAKLTDKTIREHPYQSLGLAFAVGVLIGALVTRK